MKRESKVIELWPEFASGSGLHLLGEWYGCGGPRVLLEDAVPLRGLCLNAAEKAELTILGHLFHQRAPTGVTGAVLLAESHLVIQTSPTDRSLTLDVYVSMRTRSNRAKARAVYAFLRDELLPDKENFLQVNRGGPADARPAPH